MDKRKETKTRAIIYLISDSLGETARKMIEAVTVQFPDVHFHEIKKYPFVAGKDELVEILRDAQAEDAIVVTTFVKKELNQFAAEFAAETDLHYVDLMSPFSKIIETKYHVQSTEEPGALYKMNKDYFDRVAAIEFAVRYDDGKDPRGFLDADIVLLGVSRTSKTPLSIYLANRGFKVANLPLIPEAMIPNEIYQVPSEKIIGLTTNAYSLMKIRESRLNSLGLNRQSAYTAMDRIHHELDYAQEVFTQLNVMTINVDMRSIEETAALIEEYRKNHR